MSDKNIPAFPVQLDIRVGAVAVYRGQPVNCFSDLPHKPNLLYYGNGYWKNDKWNISPIKILIAKIIYWLAARSAGKGE